MWRKSGSLLLSFWVAACSSIGPATVSRDRADYVNAIGTSWERETLLNIIKLRYGHPRLSLGHTGTASNFTSVEDVLGLTGIATAQGQYTDRPTVIYTPLTGVDFLQKLMTPLPPSAVLFVLQAGYPADVIMPIALDSINGIHNVS